MQTAFAARLIGVDKHDRAEGRICREDEGNPEEADAADNERSDDGRNDGDAEAAEVATCDLVEHREYVGRDDDRDACIAELYDLRVAVEESDHLMAEDEDKDDDRNVCDEAFGERDLEDGAAARKLAGAIVLADERRAGLAEGVQEVVDDRLDRDAGARCCHDGGAETVDGRLDHDVRKREDGTLDTCRKADAHDLGSRAAVPVELRRLHPDGRVDFQEPHKQDECTRKIAEIGCKRRSHNKPAEDADEEVAEGHIEKGCDSKGLERQTGDAHRAEDGRFEIVEQDGRKREEIDTQEQHCLTKCLFRHKQEPEQRLCGNLSDDGHSNAHKGHEHGGMHGLRDRILVAPADSSGNRHIGAKGNADKEANQKARDRRVRADGSHAEGSEIS